MRTFLLLLALFVAAVGGYNAAAPPTLKTPLVLTIRQTVGMTPFTLRTQVRAAAEGREVCVAVEGPESLVSCRTLQGITWVQDFILRTGGDYAVWATSETYRTPAITLRVVGIGDPSAY